jgi:glycogen synthase
MNILFLTPAFPPFPGGGERYALLLANELARRGHTITILTSSAQTEQAFWRGDSKTAETTPTGPPNLHIIRCPVKPFPGGRSALLLWRKMMVLLSMLPGGWFPLLLRMARQIPPIPGLEPTLKALNTPFDIIHTFNLSWEYPLTAGWRYARRHNLPLVVTPYTHFGTGRDRVARNSTMDHQRRILTDADAVLTLTTIEQEGLVKLGLQPERVTTIHGGLDRPAIPPDPAAIRRDLNISSPYLLYVGRASFDKGAVHAAQAVIRLNHGRSTPLPLILAGQSTPEFERLYHKLPAPEKDWIRPLGIVTDQQKQALLAGAELLLLPSRTDSFGIVLLEAWGYGKPVIGARAGGIPAVIDHGRNGLLIEFGDVPALVAAIQQIIDNEAQKEALGRAGLEKVNAVYSWEKVGRRVEELYRRVARQ